jgi:hypothetical protein
MRNDRVERFLARRLLVGSRIVRTRSTLSGTESNAPGDAITRQRKRTNEPIPREGIGERL